MDSSVAKYQEFSSSQNGEMSFAKPKSSTSHCLAIGLVLLVIILVATVIGIIVATAIGLGVNTTTSSSDEKKVGLTTINITQGELEGEYYGPNGDGIHFESSDNDTYVVLSITTSTNGELVVLTIHSVVSNMTMTSVNHTDFMIMENQPGRPKYDDYMVPQSHMNMTMSVIMGERNMTDDMLQHLDNGTVNETRKSVLHDLAMSDEAVLIIAAAQALGELGVEGTDYPAAMHFYQFALRLANARIDTVGGSNTVGDSYDDMRQRRQGEYCSSNGATCPSGRCPYRQGSNNCFGLCGKGCSCWKFVCKSCCVHEYCRSHDQCCEDKGYDSWACFSVLWKRRRCSQPYSCNLNVLLIQYGIWEKLLIFLTCFFVLNNKNTIYMFLLKPKTQLHVKGKNHNRT